MDEAVKSYLIPQLRYYLPKARRIMTLSSQDEGKAAISKLEGLREHVTELGLLKSSRSIQKIIDDLNLGVMSSI